MAIKKRILVYRKKKPNIYHYNAEPAKIGEVHTWADGSQHKKTSEGWVAVTRGKGKEKIEKDKKKFMDSSDQKELKSKISEGLNISPENIYIHSTTFDGLKDLWEWQNGSAGEYLSTSSIDGSTKFLEKLGNNVFTILEAPKEDVDFHEWGDVGWKGGTPKKTSYDEAGLKKWNFKGLLIPPYYKNNEKEIMKALLAADLLSDETDYEFVPKIIGVDKGQLHEANKKLDKLYEENPTDNFSQFLELYFEEKLKGQ
jgi:hypothetical protein